MIRLIFLGTSSMVPTKQRNVQSIYLEYKTDHMLFDCGEGTQRQMNILGLNRLKLSKIFISHWHGDHVSGLIGLIQTISSSPVKKELTIYGPKGTKERVKYILKTCVFSLNLNLKIKEFNLKTEKIIDETDSYYISAINLDHGIPCIGFSFHEKDKFKIVPEKIKKIGLKPGSWLKKIQKNESINIGNKEIDPEDVSEKIPGKKITFIFDTLFTKNSIELAKNSDLLISESVYANDLQELANKYKHMTAHDAAKIAERSESKQLILTHFSQRYTDVKVLVEDAREVFKNTFAAYDFMEVVINKDIKIIHNNHLINNT